MAMRSTSGISDQGATRSRNPNTRSCNQRMKSARYSNIPGDGSFDAAFASASARRIASGSELTQSGGGRRLTIAAVVTYAGPGSTGGGGAEPRMRSSAAPRSAPSLRRA